MGWILGAFCLAIVLASLAGGALPLATVLTHTRLQLYLSFSAGVMLGAVFFHMLPEAVAAAPATALHWTALGLLALFFLERFFAFHHHETDSEAGQACAPHDHGHEHVHDHAPLPAPAAKGRALLWSVAAIGLAVHTIVGGVALASAAAAGSRVTLWGVFLATVLHKPADALTIVSLMLRAGVSRPLAHLVNFGFALMLPLGVLLFFGGLQAFGDQGAAFASRSLAFSAGTFLCIALSDLLPELQFHAHDRWKLSAALLAGFGLMVAAAVGE